MAKSYVIVLAALLLLGGCGPQIASVPLTSAHPASPEATEAVIADPARTLRKASTGSATAPDVQAEHAGTARVSGSAGGTPSGHAGHVH